MELVLIFFSFFASIYFVFAIGRQLLGSQVKNATKNQFHLRFKLLFVLTRHHNFSSFELRPFKQVQHDKRAITINSQNRKILEYSLCMYGEEREKEDYCTEMCFLGAFTKLQNATINFVTSVRPSVDMEQLGSAPSGRIFIKFHI